MSAVATFVLAGGEGRRLLPLTAETPKPAVPFGPEGRIIDFVLDNCLRSGLTSVAVLTQYRPARLESYVARRWLPRFQAEGGAIAMVRAGVGPIPAYPGTADAILADLDGLRRDLDTVLVLAADHVYRMDYGAFVAQHVRASADLTIAAVDVPIAEATRFGVLEADAKGRVTGFAEKPARPAPLPGDPSRALVSMGIYVLRRSALERARDLLGPGQGRDFGRHVIPAILAAGMRVQVHRHRERSGGRGLWFDVGTPEALIEASLALHPRGAVAEGAEVAAGARVVRSVLQPRTRVADGAIVVDSFLLEGARVEAGARVERAVIGPGTIVRAGAVVAPETPGEGRVVVLSTAPESVPA